MGPIVVEVTGTNELTRELRKGLIQFVFLDKIVGNIAMPGEMFDVHLAGVASITN